MLMQQGIAEAGGAARARSRDFRQRCARAGDGIRIQKAVDVSKCKADGVRVILTSLVGGDSTVTLPVRAPHAHPPNR